MAEQQTRSARRRRGALSRAICGLTAILAALLLYSPHAVAIGDDVDFDDDGQDDYVVYRRSPLEGFWFILSPKSGQVLQYQWGLATDIPVPGQYSQNLRPDLAVYRPSTGVWFIRDWDETLEFAQIRTIQWGGFPGDVPVPCDYNGNSRQDLGIYRAGQWFLLLTPSFSVDDAEIYTFGAPGDVPVPRDFDGDDRCDLAVYRPSAGSFFVLLSSSKYRTTAVVPMGGAPGDIPVPGRYDNDDFDDFALYRPGLQSRWIIQKSTTQRLTSFDLGWGTAGDLPVVSDIDGDQLLDIGVWRPSDGTWYILRSSSDFSASVVQPFGLNSALGVDVPLGQVRDPASYLPVG